MMKGVRLFLWFFLLTGVIYPALVTLFAFLFFPESSTGSFIYREDKIVGSKLIGQAFKSERYFHSRPSNTNYSALPSSGSNLGPISKALKEKVDKADTSSPEDLIFGSASGLDPHITLASALYQVKRVANARNIEENTLIKEIHSLTEQESYVNVLLLNLKIDDYAK